MNFSITLPALRSYLMEYALANDYDLPPGEAIEAAVKTLYLFPQPEARGVGKLSPEPMSPVMQRRFDELYVLWTRYSELERAVDSHDHEPFDSCEVCREAGEYAIAKAKYEREAIYYADALMCQRAKREEDVDAARDRRLAEGLEATRQRLELP